MLGVGIGIVDWWSGILEMFIVELLGFLCMNGMEIVDVSELLELWWWILLDVMLGGNCWEIGDLVLLVGWVVRGFGMIILISFFVFGIFIFLFGVVGVVIFLLFEFVKLFSLDFGCFWLDRLLWDDENGKLGVVSVKLFLNVMGGGFGNRLLGREWRWSVISVCERYRCWRSEYYCVG